MNGQAVFKFAVKVLDESARETLAAAGMTLEDIDWLIPHQDAESSMRPANRLAARSSWCGRPHGNTSAAPERRAGRIHPQGTAPGHALHAASAYHPGSTLATL
jgi:hypothetical protein